eukprot:8626466-Alexandrium_andersonii.AAC.1
MGFSRPLSLEIGGVLACAVARPVGAFARLLSVGRVARVRRQMAFVSLGFWLAQAEKRYSAYDVHKDCVEAL